MTNKDFFYCYNKDVFKFLHYIKGINYITIAINPVSMNTFSLFIKSNELQAALKEYRQLNSL